MKKVAIVGAHGLYANYGGWDQLLKNLAEKKQSGVFEYLIFNSSQSPKNVIPPSEVRIHRINLKSSGFQGLFFDFWSILICYFKVDTILLLGVQGIPLITVLSIFKRVNIVSNMGGIEWERPKFSYSAKLYLKFCFWLGLIYSRWVILDNEHYNIFVPPKYRSKAIVIPYGGVIDTSLSVTDEVLKKYPFLKDDYFLSISRSLEDNQLSELCESFVSSKKTLVLISNFSSSKYGQDVRNKFSSYDNIILINGLYQKAELDLIRRKCTAYIHTHTLCGTAPSLVEMIISRRPIISFEIPQNRFTLNSQGLFFSLFSQLTELVERTVDFRPYIPDSSICKLYDWDIVVKKYEKTYF